MAIERNMITYSGRVVEGRIELNTPEVLPEGARVTILVQDSQSSIDPEAALDQELVDEGLLSPPCPSLPSTEFATYQPVKFQGEPLSKTIVEERR
jgi:hypothetical protein